MPTGVFERSDEHRRHISEALKGKAHSPEHVRKCALAHVGKKQSPETIRKRALANTGKKHPSWTAEQKAAMSAARKGCTYKLLKRYGISLEEQKHQRSLGNKWCYEHQGWAPGCEFISDKGHCRNCGPSLRRRQFVRRVFGVEPEWYDAKWAEQGGGCAICGETKPAREGYKFLAIDHDHKAGTPRGILCHVCNMSIARFESLPGWAERATAYLARYSEGSLECSVTTPPQTSSTTPPRVE